jgi:hypothetical protein
MTQSHYLSISLSLCSFLLQRHLQPLNHAHEIGAGDDADDLLAHHLVDAAAGIGARVLTIARNQSA